MAVDGSASNMAICNYATWDCGKSGCVYNNEFSRKKGGKSSSNISDADEIVKLCMNYGK